MPRLKSVHHAPIAPLVLAVAVSCLTPAPGTAQSVWVSPRLMAMFVEGGDDGAASVGLRAEFGSSTLALFGEGGLLGAEQNCETSLPPSCSTPSGGGLELLGGVRLSLPRLGFVHPAVSLGVGAMIWDDYDVYKSGVGSIWEAEVRLGVKAFSWSDLFLGGLVRSIGQSATGGIELFRDRGTYLGIVAGLVIPVSQ